MLKTPFLDTSLAATAGNLGLGPKLGSIPRHELISFVNRINLL